MRSGGAAVVWRGGEIHHAHTLSFLSFLSFLDLFPSFSSSLFLFFLSCLSSFFRIFAASSLVNTDQSMDAGSK